MTCQDNSDLHISRLKKRADFLYVRDGRYKAIGGLVIQSRKNAENSSHIRVGFTATRKIGNAVTRNRAKRRLREVARRLLPELGQSGYDYVFIARQSTLQRKFDQLLRDGRKGLLSLT